MSRGPEVLFIFNGCRYRLGVNSVCRGDTLDGFPSLFHQMERPGRYAGSGINRSPKRAFGVDYDTRTAPERPPSFRNIGVVVQVLKKTPSELLNYVLPL